MKKLLDELGISSSLEYENGSALNFERASDNFRKADRPFFIVEEK